MQTDPARSTPSLKAHLPGGFALCMVVLLLLLSPSGQAAVPGAGDDLPTLDDARRLLSRQRYEQAIAALERITEAQPEEALAWFDLAQAHHLAGDLEAALVAGKHAATFPDHRATSLYNVACTLSQLGRAGESAAALEQALAAGFLDFDLLAIDTDLELLRDEGRLSLPQQHDYETLRHNRVEIPFLVLLPDDYDSSQSYPAAVVFAPGGMGKRSTDWMISSLWSDASQRADWIIVCAAQPENGWINHPSHHALNALMKEVRKRHRVEDDRFHFVGLGDGGRPAATYSLMSRSYVRSLLLVESLALLRWDDDELEEIADDELPLTLVVTSRDGPTRHEALRVQSVLDRVEGQMRVESVDSDEPALLSVTAKLLLSSLAAQG